MSSIRYAVSIAVCACSLAMAGCAQQGDAPAAPAGKAVASVVIPQGFSSYASESIGDNKQCAAGASVDEDGMNQRPVAYVAETSGKPIWLKSLDLPADTYQSRATHCAGDGDAVYVLLQSDTQAQQALSQTVLKVVKLRSSDGAVLGSGDVAVPGVQEAHSAWVEEGAQHLLLDGDGLRLRGQYATLKDPDARKAFEVVLKPDLSQ